MSSLSRRRFAQLLTLSGSAVLLPRGAQAMGELALARTPLPPTPQQPDERFWQQVRARFVLPRDFAFMNAANLCPASRWSARPAPMRQIPRQATDRS